MAYKASEVQVFSDKDLTQGNIIAGVIKKGAEIMVDRLSELSDLSQEIDICLDDNESFRVINEACEEISGLDFTDTRVVDVVSEYAGILRRAGFGDKFKTRKMATTVGSQIAIGSVYRFGVSEEDHF